MQALLIRHGKTPGNEEHRYIGRTDEPLSNDGRAEAERCMKDPEQKQVYVSPYLRARETAKILFPNAKQIPVPGLRETDFGVFEGKNADEMADDPEYRAWVDSWCTGPIPGGESRDDVTRRAVRAFSRAVRSSMKKGEECVVFVTHGGVIMSILSALALPERDYYDYQTKNLSGWTVECTEEDGEIRLLNPQRISLAEK